MRTKVICVGKIKEPYLKEGTHKYMTRIKRNRVTLIEIPDSNVEKEGGKILETIKDGEYVIALSPGGEEMSSKQLAEFMKNTEKDLSIILGGPDGLSWEVYAKADKELCLSKMTFTHEMARLILVEQIYRACMINENRPYHR